MTLEDFRKLSPGEKEVVTFDLFRGISDDTTEIKEHLVKLNGQVLKNSEWRLRITGGLVVMNVVIWPTILWILNRL